MDFPKFKLSVNFINKNFYILNFNNKDCYWGDSEEKTLGKEEVDYILSITKFKDIQIHEVCDLP